MTQYEYAKHQAKKKLTERWTEEVIRYAGMSHLIPLELYLRRNLAAATKNELARLVGS